MTVKTKLRLKRPNIEMDICDFCHGPLGTPYAEVRVTDPAHVLFGTVSRMCKPCCDRRGIPTDKLGTI